MKEKHNATRIVAIVLLAFLILVGISFLPISKWSKGRLNDINLFSDILSDSLIPETEMPGGYVDPLLDAAIEEDTRQLDTTLNAEDNKPLIAVQPSKEGEQVVIEDYTESGQGLVRLRSALKTPSLARIAIVGDSYIEGDIFAEDLRELMQNKYGGSGVGYINMVSAISGFRRSVRQGGGSGWKEYAANSKHNSDYMSITQHYYKPTSSTTSTYKGSSSFANVDHWNRSEFLFISPDSTDITLIADDGVHSFHISPSPEVQSVVVKGRTTKLDIKTSSTSLIGIGTWLSDTTGVNVDCISSRGFSGVTLSKINPQLTQQMRKHVDYDLIILEFGINAMSASQKNYDAYGRQMVKVIQHVKACYPRADILLLGIGDRGSKRGSDVHSMSVAPIMVNAQREAARQARCLFWDTREAMGGEDAIVNWVRQGWANSDYIHLNHKGGRHLAEPLFKAIELNIEK